MRMAFFFDQSRCIGCNACTVSCKDYYNVNPGPVRYRKQWTHEPDTDHGNGIFYSFVMSCNHCKDPACATACGAGAITKRADGIVIVDRNKCQGLESCITACPFAEPGIADDRQEPDGQTAWLVKHPMQKCTMCAPRIDRNEPPVCVEACPVRAIEVGDYDVLLSRHPGAEPLTKDKFPYAYEEGANLNTGPSLIIKPRKSLTITGPNK